MQLECAQHISSANASEAEIRKAFSDDYGRGEFIILSETKRVFIQAAGEYDGPYRLEYSDGEGGFFRCASKVTKAEVETAFLKYLKGDATWKTEFHWKKLEYRMRNRIFGGIGVLWGGAVLVYSLLRDGPQGRGAYAAGQVSGIVLGGLLFVVGLYFLVRGGRPKKREESARGHP